MLHQKVYEGENLEFIWLNILKDFIDSPISYIESSPRGMITREFISPVIHLLNPRNRYIINHVRNLNFVFAFAEFLWIMSGSNRLDMISFYNSEMVKFSDDGKVLHGAYGERLDKYNGNKHDKNQIDLVVKKLKEDKNSRQAVSMIFNPTRDYVKTKDVPCTCLFQFFIRDERLHMIVYMRSNDIWLGLPYDIHQFTMIQEFVAAKLGVQLGEYFHHVGSLHIYSNNFEKAQDVLDYWKINVNCYTTDKYPGIMNENTVNELFYLIEIEKQLRVKGNSLAINMLNENSYWMPFVRLLEAYKYKKDGDIKAHNRIIKNFIPEYHIIREFYKNI